MKGTRLLLSRPQGATGLDVTSIRSATGATPSQVCVDASERRMMQAADGVRAGVEAVELEPGQLSARPPAGHGSSPGGLRAAWSKPVEQGGAP